MTSEKMIKIIGIISIIYGVISGLSVLVLLMMTGWQVSSQVFYLVAILAMLLPFSLFIGGIGLINHKKWGRILLIIAIIYMLIKLIFDLPDAFSHTIGLFYFVGIEFLKIGISIWFLVILFSKKTKQILETKD